MLVLTRRNNETLVIRHGDTTITVTVKRVQQNSVRLGIDAPADVKILRGEVESWPPEESHQ